MCAFYCFCLISSNVQKSEEVKVAYKEQWMDQFSDAPTLLHSTASKEDLETEVHYDNWGCCCAPE